MAVLLRAAVLLALGVLTAAAGAADTCNANFAWLGRDTQQQCPWDSQVKHILRVGPLLCKADNFLLADPSLPLQARKQQHGMPQPGHRQTRWQPVELRYIVRFKEYKMADQHRSQLQQHLRGWSGQDWRWVARRNAATKFPTDFALLELDTPNLDAVKVGPVSLSITAVTDALASPSRVPTLDAFAVSRTQVQPA